MKKTKLIALTMVVALMMVGAGYAAWSDTLTISGVVDTGYLDVHFVDLPYTEEVITDENMSGNIKYETVGNEVMNKAVVTVNDVYPGSKFEVNLKIKNNSTMPVQLSAASANKIISTFGFLAPHVVCNTTLNGDSINLATDDIPVNGLVNFEFLVDVPFDNRIPENRDFTGSFDLEFIQFNVVQ